MKTRTAVEAVREFGICGAAITLPEAPRGDAQADRKRRARAYRLAAALIEGGLHVYVNSDDQVVFEGSGDAEIPPAIAAMKRALTEVK